MKRNSFVRNLPREHIFLPSVGEIWKAYGEEWLLEKTEKTGFATIKVNGKATLNCDQLDYFTSKYKFVRVASDEEISNIKKRYKKEIEGELSIAS